MIALIIFSHRLCYFFVLSTPKEPLSFAHWLIDSLLFIYSSEKLEKLHGGGVRDDKSRVITGSEHPAPALRIDSLHGQIHGKNIFPMIICSIIIHSHTQPRPYLTGLPWLRQSNQSGNDGLHGRGLFRWYIILLIAVYAGISIRIPVNGCQSEFLPVAGLRKLNLYFCVVHD
nr:MAG TPA: hypothetical protein [Caudoviricetes sp.]